MTLPPFHNIPKVFRCIRADRALVLPPDYIAGFAKAEQTFLHQRVFDHINKKIVSLTPLPEHLDGNSMEFLGRFVCFPPTPLRFFDYPSKLLTITLPHSPIADEIACLVAIGDMDPSSFRYFEDPTPPQTLQRVTTPRLPSAPRGRVFNGLRRSFSRPLLLPPQKNVISNYFSAYPNVL